MEVVTDKTSAARLAELLANEFAGGRGVIYRFTIEGQPVDQRLTGDKAFIELGRLLSTAVLHERNEILMALNTVIPAIENRIGELMLADHEEGEFNTQAGLETLKRIFYDDEVNFPQG